MRRRICITLIAQLSNFSICRKKSTKLTSRRRHKSAGSLRSVEEQSTMECLPNEILIKILGHLNSFDLMKFCQAYEHLDYFLREKYIIWHSDWSRNFELQDLNICKFISTKMNPSLIKVLNINGLYWIRFQDLKMLISKLSSLEELYAVDTKLRFYDSVNMDHLRLRKLAISVEESHFLRPIYMSATTKQIIFKLKYLYLKIYLQNIQNRGSISRLIVENSFNLEEFWLEDFFESPHHIRYDRLLISQDNLKKVVIRCNALPFFDSSDTFGLTKVFECTKWSAASDVIFERRPGHTITSNKSIFDPKSSALEEAWDLLKSRLRDLPCGPKGRKLLALGEHLENVLFEELDFFYSFNTCYPKFNDAALVVLNSPNSKKLKKLRMSNCLWQKFDSEKDAEDSRVVFKRPRLGVQTEPAHLHPFHKIAENIKYLTELVIINHRGCREHEVIPAYELLGILENLKKLSLRIPLLLDGTFLKEVFTKCKVLESLYIECKSTNEKFMMNLCHNLKLSTALRDFKLTRNEITIDNLLEGLNEISNRKLLRLVMKCDVIRFSQSTSEIGPFSAFLESNPQLVLFYLCAGKNPKKQLSDIHKTVHKFRVGNLWKIFLAKTEECYEVPTAHYDILFDPDRVAAIDFNEF